MIRYLPDHTLAMVWIKSNPTIVSEAEINPNLYFNASNLKDGVKERTDMTEADGYLMNRENYQPKIKLPYMLECTSRLSYQKPSDYTTLCGKIIGQIVGDYRFDHGAVAKEIFNSAVGSSFCSWGRSPKQA